jgi:hypothetical protein
MLYVWEKNTNFKYYSWSPFGEKTMKKHIKIFDGKLIDIIPQALKEGYTIQNAEQVWKLRDKKKIPFVYYDTSTIFHKGVFRDATKAELKNIQKTYEQGKRLVWLASVGNINSVASSNLNLDNYHIGRLVGVKKE